MLRDGDMRDNVVLIGMPGSGKSTVGVILAKLLGYDFIDTDLLIQKRAGKRLPEIIDDIGINGFLTLEEDVCAAVTAERTVIATGGSVVYGERAMRHLKELGRILYLSVDYDALCRRLSDIRGRGVALRPGQTLRQLYDERAVLYRRWADIAIQEDDDGLEETVAAVQRLLFSIANRNMQGNDSLSHASRDSSL